jgi:NADH-quinone oxidoreductase subunit N
MTGLLHLLPETFQLVLAIALFVVVLVRPDRATGLKWLPYAALASVVVAGLSLTQSASLFEGSYRIDGLSQFFKLTVAIGFFIASLNAMEHPTLKPTQRTDFFMFLALSAWGLMLLSSAVELMTIFIALEISSYSLYGLVPLRTRDRSAAEAGIKYILFGAAATAISLYGFSYIVAGQQTTYLAELITRPWSFALAPGAVIGLIMFMAGFFYKLALFPFHFWCPDVYQGTSNETAAYVATLPKLGAVVILIRLASMLTPGLGATTLIAVLGAVSMTFGNLAALAQKDVKRLLGYSSIAHAGYVTVGLVAGTAEGLAAAAFYSLVYIIMNLTCFWVICRISGDGRNLQLNDLNGMFKTRPALAFVLAVGAFALVGLPPTGGFMGKLFLFSAAWGRGYDWLVILAALNTAISIYYYLNLVRHAYTDEPGESPMPEKTGGVLFAGVLAGVTLVLGLFPARFFELAMRVTDIMK